MFSMPRTLTIRTPCGFVSISLGEKACENYMTRAYVLHLHAIRRDEK